ncbi:MAG: hypothetical protein QW821_03895, partial [Candidatus Bathyarchaeia archaeon]
QPALKTLVDVWNVNAEARIGEEIVRDSLTFEVKALPSLDIYTNKGGKGHNVSSNAFFYNETITIYANVIDANIHLPIENMPVKFYVNGPPNKYQNITYKEEKITDAYGNCAIILENMQSKPFEIIIGNWSIKGILENVGFDIITFEVMLPQTIPTLGIDVYTDRGGKGLRRPSLAYESGETVYIFAMVTNATGGPLKNYFVSFAVVNPKGAIVHPSSSSTNESGIATTSFTTLNVTKYPEYASDWIGTWIVYANVEINGQRYIDTLTFECVAKPSE